MIPRDLEVKKLEYSAAQDMLKHYDTLNWQIGSILIAGVVVLTGLVVNKDTAELMRCSREVARVLTSGIPGMSLMIMGAWCLWFHRHRDLYNFRNETLHRIEAQLGMYHFLRVAEANLTLIGLTQLPPK
jgi:hypothetical protein